MPGHEKEDPRAEGLGEKADVEVFNIGMFESGSEGSRFNIRNNPENPYQRSEIIQRTSPGMITRCTMIDAVHGAMSADSDFWATLLVFQFRFDPQGRHSRVSEAKVELHFDVSDANNTLPEVEAVSYDGHYSLLPSTHSETLATSASAGVGVSYVAELNASVGWERAVTIERPDATTISGGKLMKDNRLPHRVAEWTLMENKTLETGVPTSVQVAIRIKRRDEAIFTCIPKLRCKTHERRSLRSFFGGVPEVDPVLLKPDMKPTNRLRVYDTEELGSVDLQELSGVTPTQMILDALK
ncbi:hypothetical protein FSARC_2983 [Fusarium sarcochroum]|uniref:Uncharacterized protein n=1 Tax=Fusarium sarcochroum TaxID=1208366 RepID=A0A8H4XCE4_9HYPO|nr:hypothetical protein FSARC_2983 [Fusarium sarcochroum]